MNFFKILKTRPSAPNLLPCHVTALIYLCHGIILFLDREVNENMDEGFAFDYR